jgi:hypothetical protein
VIELDHPIGDHLSQEHTERGVRRPEVSAHHVHKLLHHGVRILVEFLREDLSEPSRLLEQQPTRIGGVVFSASIVWKPLGQSFSHILQEQGSIKLQ